MAFLHQDAKNKMMGSLHSRHAHGLDSASTGHSGSGSPPNFSVSFYRVFYGVDRESVVCVTLFFRVVVVVTRLFW